MALFDFISARLDSLKFLGRLDELVEEVCAIRYCISLF